MSQKILVDGEKEHQKNPSKNQESENQVKHTFVFMKILKGTI